MLQALFALLAVTGAGFIGYWVQDSTSPVMIIREWVDDGPVAPGGVLKVRYEIERTRQCGVLLQQILYDTNNVRFIVPDQDFEVEPGPVGHENFAVAVMVPKDFAQGQALYRAIRSYRCNPVQRFFKPLVVRGPEVKFMVAGEPIPTAVEVKGGENRNK